jgi:hypothetical protein
MAAKPPAKATDAPSRVREASRDEVLALCTPSIAAFNQLCQTIAGATATAAQNAVQIQQQTATEASAATTGSVQQLYSIDLAPNLHGQAPTPPTRQPPIQKDS